MPNKHCPCKDSHTQGTTLYLAVMLTVRLFSKPYRVFLLGDRKSQGIELHSLSSHWKSEKDNRPRESHTVGTGYLSR